MMLLLLLGCGGKNGGDDGDASPLGTIVAERAGEAADVLPGAAFGFDSPSNGKALVYLSSNPDVTCDQMATVLEGPSADEWDPAVILPPGTCSMFLYATYDGDGAWDIAPGEMSVDALVVYNCAMDDGEWVESGDCEGGFCYSGHYWQGSPQAFSVTLSGGDGADYALSLETDQYAGGFTYESFDDAPASGRVAGELDVGWCPGFGTSSYF